MLSFELSSNPTLFILSQLRLLQLQPLGTVPATSCVPLTTPLSCFCGSCGVLFYFYFLARQDAPGSSWPFPAPALESAISRRSRAPCIGASPAEAVVLALEHGVRNQDLGTGVLGAAGGCVSLPVSLSWWSKETVCILRWAVFTHNYRYSPCSRL